MIAIGTESFAKKCLSIILAPVLLGEWFGDTYFPLKEEIAGRGWTMKRVGVELF